MYTVRNFRTKKELRLAVEAWKAGTGPEVRYYQPGPFGGNEPTDGTFCLEGPHYPEPHRWYATATAEAGRIVSVR